MKRFWFAACALVLACGDASPLGPTDFSPARGALVTSVTVVPAADTVAVGQTAQLQVIVKSRHGGSTTTTSATWVSANAKVATVSTTGLVKGIAVGNVTITATVSGKSGTSAITVIDTVTTPPPPPPAPSSVTVAPSASTVLVGTKVQLAATVKDSAGHTLTGQTIAWSSSAPAIATVDTAGLVTTVAVGTATITAKTASVLGTATVTDTAATPPPPPPPTTHAGYYVSPTGSASNSGTMASPWTLASVLNGTHTSSIVGGDTVWIRAGTYTGNFLSYVSGAVVRAYPGERATVNGTLSILGSYSTFWGLEVMSSAPLSSSGIGINVKAPGTKLINMVIHDAGYSGVGMWNEAPNSELYGSIIYNNGTHDNLDHGAYFNGNSGSKTVRDNIVFANWAFGLHAYSSISGELQNLHIDGNTSFNNGAIGAYTHNPDIYAGGSTINGLWITNNATSQWTDAELTMWVQNGGSNFTLTGNYTVGGTSIASFSGSTVSGNTAWSAGSPPTSGQYVLIRPNVYEPGRANITVYNWGGAASAVADLSGVLRVGDTYEIHEAQAFYGAPVASGTYGGGTVSLPMAAVTPPTPIGRSSNPPRSTGTKFHVFVVTRTN